MLANARIKCYVTFGKYNDNSFTDLFREVGIEYAVKPRPSAEVTFQD